jgi:hypothetical protein
MVEGISIRQAALDDVGDLIRLRRLLLESMGSDDGSQQEAGDEAAATRFRRAIPAAELQGWLAVTPAGEAFASSTVVIDRHPPGPSNLRGRTG